MGSRGCGVSTDKEQCVWVGGDSWTRCPCDRLWVVLTPHVGYRHPLGGVGLLPHPTVMIFVTLPCVYPISLGLPLAGLGYAAPAARLGVSGQVIARRPVNWVGSRIPDSAGTNRRTSSLWLIPNPSAARWMASRMSFRWV